MQVFLLALGLLAGTWALLTPLLVFLPLYYADTATEVQDKTNALDAGRLGEAMMALGPSAAAGVVCLAAMALLKRGQQIARPLLGLSALGLLALSIFTAASLGPFFFPPALLMAFPTLWFGATQE